MSKIAHLPKPAARASAARSPARIALAAAIERLAEIQREAEEMATARERLSEMRGPAIRAEEATKAAIETAKTNAAAYYTAVALGTTDGRPQSLKEAHAAHAAAVDECESLTSASLALRGKAHELDGRVRLASMGVNTAVKAVIVDEASAISLQLAAEYEALARELAKRHAALDWLSIRGTFGIDVWRPSAPSSDATGPRAAWQMAEDALRANPDAPLPIPTLDGDAA